MLDTSRRKTGGDITSFATSRIQMHTAELIAAFLQNVLGVLHGVTKLRALSRRCHIRSESMKESFKNNVDLYLNEYKVLREYIVQQRILIDQRTKWSLTFNAFLLGSLYFLISGEFRQEVHDYLLKSNHDVSDRSVNYSVLMFAWVLWCSGFYFCWVSLFNILSAQRALLNSAKIWEERQKLFRRIFLEHEEKSPTDPNYYFNMPNITGEMDRKYFHPISVALSFIMVTLWSSIFAIFSILYYYSS